MTAGCGGAGVGGGTGGAAAGRAEGAETMVASASPSGCASGTAGAFIAARIASANAVAEGKRSSGRFAIARLITASNAGGAVTESCDGHTGSVFNALCMIAERPPSKGRSPVSNWYSITPDE